MTSNISVRCVDDEDKFTQKCNIPLSVLQKGNFKIADFISIKCSSKIYICKVFLTDIKTCVLVDDVVTCTSNAQNYSNFHGEWTIFPNNFTSIKVSSFIDLKVKLVLSDYKVVSGWNKSTYEDVIRKLLLGYVIGKNCTVKCIGQPLADLFFIHSIMITETCHEESVFGRITRSSNIEMIEIISREQLFMMKECENIELGGIDDTVRLLNMNLFEVSNVGRRILLYGPSGCGKSSLVRKFCFDFKCFVVVIDGLKARNLNKEKCNMYYECLVHSCKLFPKRPCVLFVDHLDHLASLNSKQMNVLHVSFIISLMKRLENTDVSVIAAVTQKQVLHSVVLRLFHQEVVMTMPSLHQRRKMLQILTKPYSDTEVDCEKVARMTPGFVANDILLLIKEAINTKKQSKYKESTSMVHLTSEDLEEALLHVSPSVLKASQWSMKVKPVYWKDIGSMEKIKERLQMYVEWPLHNPEVFKKVDLPCPHGILLFGPPGCCKTTLARGLATECNANFFAANPAQIYSPFVGESEKNINELFYQARLCAPSIIFLDELDSLVGRRELNSKSQGIGEKVLSTLLNEMDGFGTRIQFANNLYQKKLLNHGMLSGNDNATVEKHSNNEVIVVAATNRPDLIDDALLRPGRFDVIMYIPPPSTEERQSILQTITEGMPLKEVNLKKIAEKTPLFSGADLKNLCNKAALSALRQDISAENVTEENFLQALNDLQPSISKKQIQIYEQLSSKYGQVIR